MRQMNTKVWDIIQPTNDWERGYAKLAYEYEGLRQVFAKRIDITTPQILFDSVWLQREAEKEVWAAEDAMYGR
jgi:hypothetical protein